MSPASESPTSAVGSDLSSGVGFGFGAREYRQSQPQHRSQPPPPPRPTTNHRGNTKPDKSKLWCSHCGMNKHTKDTCFQLIGYPDWWEEEKAAKAKVAIGTEGGGKNQGGTGAEGSRETAQFQERRPETGGLQIGGGRRGDNGGGRTTEVMIASLKLDGAESGGKGLESENPNPNTFSLAIKSPINEKCEKRPHFRSIT